MAKILFLGGCHVIGFKVGKQAGFAHLASTVLSEKLNKTIEILALPYIIFNDRDTLENIIKPTIIQYQPDMIVLQLGNYGFSPSIIDWRKALSSQIIKQTQSIFSNTNLQERTNGQAGATKSSLVDKKWYQKGLETGIWPEEIDPNIYACFSDQIKPLSFYQQIKQDFSHLLIKNAGFPQINLKLISQNINLFFEQIYSYSIPAIAFTPFPSMEPQTDLYRQEGLELIIQNGYAYDFPVINTHNIFINEDLNKYYLDLVHMNAKGHAKVAQHLSDRILGSQTLTNALLKADLP